MPTGVESINRLRESNNLNKSLKNTNLIFILIQLVKEKYVKHKYEQDITIVSSLSQDARGRGNKIILSDIDVS